MLISCFSSAYCWVRNAVTVDTGQVSAGDPMLVRLRASGDRFGGNGSTPPYSPITDA